MRKLLRLIMLLMIISHQGLWGQSLQKQPDSGSGEIFGTNVYTSTYLGWMFGTEYKMDKRSIRESTPILPEPADAPTIDGVLKYVEGYGVLVRKNGMVYPVANRGYSPVSLSNPTPEHKIGRIIYHKGAYNNFNGLYNSHFYEGVADGKWVQIDNKDSYIIPQYITVNPSDKYVDYDAGQTTFNVYSNVSNWQVAGSYSGINISPITGSLNAILSYSYTANTTNAYRIFNHSIYLPSNTNIPSGLFKVTQLYKPYFGYSNIINVYGKEQSGTVPAEFKGKVNPGPERFFAWIGSPTNFRMRIKYNDSPPSEGFAFSDPINGDYDYEFPGQSQEWAYEYQLKENKTGADRKISIEISYQKLDGDWRPWESINLKNSDGSFVTQASITPALYANRKWSERYAGANETAKNVGFVYPNTPNGTISSKYVNQFGTELSDITNSHTLVTSYYESGIGSEAGTWKLPDDSDLQNLKTVGFIPNRPFKYVGGNLSGLAPGNNTYNNWSTTRTTFLDNTVQSQNKVGYGNAFYLYDKTGKLIWFPENGMRVKSYNNFMNTNSEAISSGLYILGTNYGISTNTSKTSSDGGFYQPITCSLNNNTYTEYRLQRLGTSSTTTLSPPKNGVLINTTIGSTTPYYGGDSSSLTIEAKSRTCTPSPECGSSGTTPVFGPWQPFNCSPWQPANSYDYHSNNRSFTYRLVHD